MEKIMRHLASVLLEEFAHFGWECIKWALIGVAYLVSLWFLTAGLPLVVALINR